MKVFSQIILTIASLSLLSGCADPFHSKVGDGINKVLGDLFQKDVVKREVDSSRFKAECELNVDEFSLILEEPIGDTIDCLGKNLKLFIKVVETKRPGYLYRKSLEQFIIRNRRDIKPEVLKALKAVFDVNFLVYGEDQEYISAANIDALVKFAKLFNEKASHNFKPLFLDDNEMNYSTYRNLRDGRMKQVALEITSALREIYNPNRGGQVHKLDINNLLDSFTNENNRGSMDTVKKLLFAKKVLLGGDKNTLTHVELGRLVDNFHSVILLALDLVRFQDIRLNQEATVQFLNSDLEILNNLVFANAGSRDEETLFTMDDAIEAVDLFLDDSSSFNPRKYLDLIREAKVTVMEGSAETITGGDLRRLFNHGFTILKDGILFHRFWYTERLLLEDLERRPISYNFDNLYRQFPREKDRIDQFVRIVKKYRFQKGENVAAFYTDEYWRNADAVFETALYEYALTLVMRKYGCPNLIIDGVKCEGEPTLNGVWMTKDHVINVVKKFRKILIDNDIIYPGREEKTAETITLLGSLFQYQSDENKIFDVNEATEFAISLFTAIDISEKTEKFYRTDEAKCQKDQFGRYEPTCFRKNFFRGICLNYGKHFPKLFKSLGAPVDENNNVTCDIPDNAANNAYLERAIVAARNCNVYPDTKEEIYYTKSDMMTIMLAMMHIETTIIRWDVVRPNNYMDPSEVMNAYSIYAPALDGFLEKMPSVVKKLKKQIYQFLVKYEQVPDAKDMKSIWKFAKFLLSFNKNANANRKTIASILVTIGDQGAKSRFDCNLLHDPDSIPEDYDPNQLSAPTEVLARNYVLTREDDVIATDINNDNDSLVKTWIHRNFPGLLGFSD